MPAATEGALALDSAAVLSGVLCTVLRCRAEKAVTPEDAGEPVEEAPGAGEDVPAADAVDAEPEVPKEPEKVSVLLCRSWPACHLLLSSIRLYCDCLLYMSMALPWYLAHLLPVLMFVTLMLVAACH